MMRITGGIQRGWSSRVGPTEPGEAQTISKIEYRLLQSSNRERDAGGVASELTLDETLGDIARKCSGEMRDRGFFSHTSPSGATLRQRLEAAGVDYSRTGENIAQVPHERHRAYILDSEFSQVGIGVARSIDIYSGTQVLVTP